MARGLADLRALADDQGFISSSAWNEFVSPLSQEEREGLRSEIFGEGMDYESSQDNFMANSIFEPIERISRGWEVPNLGSTGLGDNQSAAASPFAPPEEQERIKQMYDLYMEGNSGSWYDNPFSIYNAVMNPIGLVAKQSGVSTGAQNVIDIASNLGNLGVSLPTQGMDTMARSKSSGLDRIMEGVDTALDPLHTGYYLGKAGEQWPEDYRSKATSAGTIAGGAIGSIFPVVGTAAGAAAGRLVGGKIAGETPLQQAVGTGLTYGAASLGGLKGAALKFGGGMLANELFSSSGMSGPTSYSRYLRLLGEEDPGIIEGDSGVISGDTESMVRSSGLEDTPIAGKSTSGYYSDIIDELNRLRKKRTGAF